MQRGRGPGPVYIPTEAYSCRGESFPQSYHTSASWGRLGSSDTAYRRCLRCQLGNQGPWTGLAAALSNSIRERSGLGRLPACNVLNQTILKTKFKTCHPKQQALAAAALEPGSWLRPEGQEHLQLLRERAMLNLNCASSEVTQGLRRGFPGLSW